VTLGTMLLCPQGGTVYRDNSKLRGVSLHSMEFSWRKYLVAGFFPICQSHMDDHAPKEDLGIGIDAPLEI
jgi:hypothetical protein